MSGTILTSGAAFRWGRGRWLIQSADVWQQGDGAGSFDGGCHCPLMFGAGPGYAPWNDLSPFSDKMFEYLRIFVFDLQATVGTETANLAPVVESFFAGTAPWFECHDSSPPSCPGRLRRQNRFLPLPQCLFFHRFQPCRQEAHLQRLRFLRQLRPRSSLFHSRRGRCLL